jgi:5-methylcytosine-specific restriction endonuclease McrA
MMPYTRRRAASAPDRKPNFDRALKKSATREVFRRVSSKERAWVVSPDFLRSDQWTRLRYDAREHNRRIHGRNCCAACGQRGGANGRKLNVDHIYPRKHFPQLALILENLQVLCADCNKGKGNRYATDWREPEKTPKMRPSSRTQSGYTPTAFGPRRGRQARSWLRYRRVGGSLPGLEPWPAQALLPG